MCGRYVSPADYIIEQYYGARIVNPFAEVYNAAPSMLLPVVRSVDGALVCEPMQWGLIPVWWSKEELPTHTINARSEDAAGKPMWRAAVKSTRAIIPARGYFEWKGAKPPKQPYFIHSPDGEPLSFAGLWSEWQHPDRDPLRTFAILTTAASPAMAEIHNRMPVVLPRAAWQAWLDPQQRDGGEAVQAAVGAAVGDMDTYPVSTYVNSVRNQGERTIEPAES